MKNTDFLNPLKEKFELEAVKYLISKQIFCPYSNNILDINNCILIELYKGNDLKASTVIHGTFAPKINELKEAFKARNLEAKITEYIK